MSDCLLITVRRSRVVIGEDAKEKWEGMCWREVLGYIYIDHSHEEERGGGERKGARNSLGSEGRKKGDEIFLRSKKQRTKREGWETSPEQSSPSDHHR